MKNKLLNVDEVEIWDEVFPPLTIDELLDYEDPFYSGFLVNFYRFSADQRIKFRVNAGTSEVIVINAIKKMMR